MPVVELKEGVKVERCPLCGSSADLNTNLTAISEPQFWVKCPSQHCGATINPVSDADEAAARWNRRRG